MKRFQMHHTLAAVALIFGLSATASATSGQWDTALAVGNDAGTGSGASGNSWISDIGENDIYAEWNVFDLYPTDATPDLGGSGVLTELTGAAFLTSGGNIYSFAAPTSFTVDTSGLDTGGTVWLRLATQGTPTTGIATLNGVEATLVETYSASLGGFGGDETEGYFMWENVAPSASFTFAFQAVESSLSLDQVAIYGMAAAVPEPASWAMMLAGLGLAGGIARRRR